jgi:hypothetical protein
VVRERRKLGVKEVELDETEKGGKTVEGGKAGRWIICQWLSVDGSRGI